MMRIAFFGIVLLLAASCTKNREVNGRMQTGLDIVYTDTPDTVLVGQKIISRVRSVGPNLCYRFELTETFATAPREYAIRSIGSLPLGDAVCAQTLLTVDTAVVIPANQPGAYILRFYNGPQLFKADTVAVY